MLTADWPWHLQNDKRRWHSIIMKKYLTIGELKISLEYETGPYEVFFEKALDAFSSGPFEHPDIRFSIDTVSPFPKLDSYRQIFTSSPDGLWTILEDPEKDHYVIFLRNAENDAAPYRIMRADRRFADFIIYTRPNQEGSISPLEYPVADLALSGHININKIGIMLHSACISLKGKAYLFAGVSGAGKSTMSEIWQQDGEAEVLTDERVLIRKLNGNIWAFGTPWHGTSEIHKNMGAPVEKIFFIRHGKENRSILISKTDAVNRLVVRCFPTFWNREGMEFALEFCSLVAQTKGCHDFQFVPDHSAASFVRKLDEGKQLC